MPLGCHPSVGATLLDTENLKEYSIIENGAWAADATEVATTLINRAQRIRDQAECEA